jgi:hypothetical protein
MDAGVMLAATFATMMCRIHISDEDLQLTEQACRSMAARYRRDAERQQNPLVRDGTLRSAAHFERIADRMRRFRNDACEPYRASLPHL